MVPVQLLKVNTAERMTKVNIQYRFPVQSQKVDFSVDI